LAQRLNGREHNAVLLHDGRRSLELVSAIYHANATATVVDLPLDASHPRYDSWITA